MKSLCTFFPGPARRTLLIDQEAFLRLLLSCRVAVSSHGCHASSGRLSYPSLASPSLPVGFLLGCQGSVPVRQKTFHEPPCIPPGQNAGCFVPTLPCGYFFLSTKESLRHLFIYLYFILLQCKLLRAYILFTVFPQNLVLCLRRCK